MSKKAERKEAGGAEIKISGTGYDPRIPEGRASLKRLKHTKESEDGIHCEMDTDKIRRIIAEYAGLEYRKETRPAKKTGGADEVFYAPISRPGLRLKLGVDRDTYNLWLIGYAEREEMSSGYAANAELADAMREGDDAIAQYLVENNDSGSSAKSIKLLEAMGEFAPISAGAEDNTGTTETKGFIWGETPAAVKWAKRAE